MAACTALGSAVLGAPQTPETMKSNCVKIYKYKCCTDSSDFDTALVPVQWAGTRLVVDPPL